MSDNDESRAEPRTESSTLAWDQPPAHVMSFTVTDADLDRFGHTNNVVYLGWLEQVAWAHSQALGLDFDAYERLGVGCVARRHELDYLAPTFVGDHLAVGTWIAEFDGRLTMTRAYQIIRVRDGRSILRGRTYWVSVDMKSGRPRRMPAEFLIYAPHLLSHD